MPDPDPRVRPSLRAFAAKYDSTITSGFRPGSGSRHNTGQAIDIRWRNSDTGKPVMTEAQAQVIMFDAVNAGFRVVDERYQHSTGMKGAANTMPHIHIEEPSGRHVPEIAVPGHGVIFSPTNPGDGRLFTAGGTRMNVGDVFPKRALAEMGMNPDYTDDPNARNQRNAAGMATSGAEIDRMTAPNAAGLFNLVRGEMAAAAGASGTSETTYTNQPVYDNLGNLIKDGLGVDLKSAYNDSVGALAEMGAQADAAEAAAKALRDGGVDGIPASGYLNNMRPSSTPEEALALRAQGFIPMPASLAGSIKQAAADTVAGRMLAADNIVELREGSMRQDQNKMIGGGLGQALANMFGGYAQDAGVGGLMDAYNGSVQNLRSGREGRAQTVADNTALNSKATMDAAAADMSANEIYSRAIFDDNIKREDRFLAETTAADAKAERLRLAVIAERMRGGNLGMFADFLKPMVTGQTQVVAKHSAASGLAAVDGADLRQAVTNTRDDTQRAQEGTGRVNVINGQVTRLRDLTIMLNEARESGSQARVRGVLDMFGAEMPGIAASLDDPKNWEHPIGNLNSRAVLQNARGLFNQTEAGTFSNTQLADVYRGEDGWRRFDNSATRLNRETELLAQIGNLVPRGKTGAFAGVEGTPSQANFQQGTPAPATRRRGDTSGYTISNPMSGTR